MSQLNSQTNRQLDKKIGFIGAGNMGEAFIGALIKAGIFIPSSIFASDIRADRLNSLKADYGILPVDDNFELFMACDIVVLSVKPQQMDEVLADIIAKENYAISNRKLVISIAAGIPIRKIEGPLYAPLGEDRIERLPIIRVMPNTPAFVLAGMSGMSANRVATVEDKTITRTVLEAVGKVIEFKEADLDAVTALSGSGPAYVFYLIESMIAGGIGVGLSAEDAATLAVTTASGAVKLLIEQKESPESLRKKVTSPGGTTEAALEILESNNVKQNIIDAIAAATRRSKDLSG
jgi:pyrroline-5-carboxylate reductase